MLILVAGWGPAGARHFRSKRHRGRRGGQATGDGDTRMPLLDARDPAELDGSDGPSDEI